MKEYFYTLMTMKPDKSIFPIQIQCLEYLVKSFLYYINNGKMEDEEL